MTINTFAVQHFWLSSTFTKWYPLWLFSKSSIAKISCACLQELLDCAQNQLDCPQNQLNCPQNKLNCPQNKLNCPQNKLNCAQNQLDCPQNQLNGPQNQLNCDKNQLNCDKKPTQFVLRLTCLQKWLGHKNDSIVLRTYTIVIRINSICATFD